MTKTTKIILWLIVAIIVIGGIWYGVSRKPAEKETVKIGVLVGLTGKYAPYGEMMIHGAELAVQDINQNIGNKKVQLVVEDTQSDINKAISAYQSIKTKTNVLISGQSGVVLGVAPLANRDGIVLFNTSAMSPDIRKAGDYVFSNINDSTVEVVFMVDHIYKEGLRKVAILFENDDAGISANDIFKKEFIKLGGTVVADESFEGKAVDVRTQLLKIKTAQPEAIYLPAYPENAALIINQADQLTIKTNWFSWNIEDPAFFKIAGNAADGMVYTSTAFDPNDKNLKINNFVKEFEQKYGTKPNIYAATAYDGIILLYEAIRTVGYSSSDIKNYLYKTKNWQGVSGITTFDNDGTVKKDVMFKTIKNGQFVPYEE